MVYEDLAFSPEDTGVISLLAVCKVCGKLDCVPLCVSFDSLLALAWLGFWLTLPHFPLQTMYTILYLLIILLTELG